VLDKIMRQMGVTISGRKALVLGYGMIGRNAARALRDFNLEVAVFDKESHRNLAAFLEGYTIEPKVDLLRRAEIIFSQTAEQALTQEDMKHCRHNAILVSLGSRNTEFDLEGLKTFSTKKEKLNDLLVRYKLPNGNSTVVVNGGTAVNFLGASIPIEVIDLIFAEMTLGALKLLRGECKPGALHTSAGTDLHFIAREWLSYFKPKVNE